MREKRKSKKEEEKGNHYSITTQESMNSTAACWAAVFLFWYQNKFRIDFTFSKILNGRPVKSVKVRFSMSMAWYVVRETCLGPVIFSSGCLTNLSVLPHWITPPANATL